MEVYAWPTDRSTSPIELDLVDNTLDMMIYGQGYFQLDDGQGGVFYTQNGHFELNNDGYIVSETGKFLQAYGLDASGNQQPIGNLSISRTELPPNPTSNIDLSFNIDSRSDASALFHPYNPDDPTTVSFSTTTNIIDSLGDEHSLTLDFIEQSSFYEQQTLTFSPAITSGNIEVAGVTIVLEAGNTSADIVALIADQETAIRTADPRIISVNVDPDNDDNLLVTYSASSADVETIVVSDVGGTGALPTITTDPYLIANEVQAVEIAVPTNAGQLLFGDVAIDVSNVTLAANNAADIVNLIVSSQDAIIEANPTIESLAADLDSVPPRVLITYVPEEGNVTELSINENGTGVFAGATIATTVNNGDNSYQGVYQLYAYLDGTELLDIGKAVPAGATGSMTNPQETEVGPVLVTFSTVNGIISSINGIETNYSVLSRTAWAPDLTLMGTDPADPDHIVSLNLSGSSQYASGSTVKEMTQDGYFLGDLIGVSVNRDGTLMTHFSNGRSTNEGIIALATFDDPTHLQSNSNNEWSATPESGQAHLNPPGTGLNGELRPAVAQFDGNYSDYEVTVTLDGFFIVPLEQPSGAESFVGVDRIQFADTNLALDVNGTAGQAYRIYEAAFDRTPDTEGLGYWIDSMEQGTTLLTVANEFISSAEFQTLYGENPTNESFLTTVYEHVLDRTPDDEGYQWWLDALDSGEESRADVLVGFSESAEHKANVIGLISDGIQYDEWLG